MVGDFLRVDVSLSLVVSLLVVLDELLARECGWSPLEAGFGGGLVIK